MQNNTCNLLLFYKSISNVNFDLLSNDDINKIQSFVDKWRTFFTCKTAGYTSFVIFTAEKMYTSNGYYGPKTKEEKALFYILMVDPKFLFLEIYESANTINERNKLAKINFRINDTFLMKLEKKCNERFQIFNSDDIWTLDRIKR